MLRTLLDFFRLRHSSRPQLMLLGAATLPFVFGLAAQYRVPVPQPLSIESPRPSLVFQQYMLRPFVPEPRAVVNARYRFVNEGTETVRIGEIERSCGCLGQKLTDTVIEPGESGEILLQVQTASESPGMKEFWAVVNFTDPAPRQVKLTMKVDIPEHQVSVQPKALLFYQLGTEPITQNVSVLDSRLQPLHIDSVSCTSELVEISTPLRIRQDGAVEHRIAVTVPGNIPPGQLRAVMTIRTNDFAFPQLAVPIIINGPAQPAEEQVNVAPEMIRLSRSSQEQRVIRVTLRRPSLNPALEITGVECSVANVEVEAAATTVVDGQQQAVIRLQIPPGTLQTSERSVLSVQVRGRQTPVTIPVQVLEQPVNSR